MYSSTNSFSSLKHPRIFGLPLYVEILSGPRHIGMGKSNINNFSIKNDSEVYDPKLMHIMKG